MVLLYLLDRDTIPLDLYINLLPYMARLSNTRTGLVVDCINNFTQTHLSMCYAQSIGGSICSYKKLKIRMGDIFFPQYCNNFTTPFQLLHGPYAK